MGGRLGLHSGIRGLDFGKDRVPLLFIFFSIPSLFRFVCLLVLLKLAVGAIDSPKVFMTVGSTENLVSRKNTEQLAVGVRLNSMKIRKLDKFEHELIDRMFDRNLRVRFPAPTCLRFGAG